MNVILFDNPVVRLGLLPFTFTRPVACIRVGILTISEKWEKHLNTTVSYSTEPYLQKKYPLRHTADNLWINGAVCPDASLVAAITQLNSGDAVMKDNMIIAVRTPDDEVPEVITGIVTDYKEPVVLIDNLCKIFQNNGAQIRADFTLITKGRKSAPITDEHTRVYNKENIFLEEGVTLRAVVLNAENGPIYLGKNTQIQEGAVIRGPYSMGEGSVVNMNAKVRGDTSIGPYCKIGGEINNTVIFGYSNKAHDGFMGNSVIGEWCNIGADTNTSNLKNNYESNQKLWSYAKGNYEDTGLMFVGTMMGDHSKCGINTMFNSGTVVGVSTSVFGAGYIKNFVPSFAWGGTSKFTTYQFDKALETAGRVLGRRAIDLTEADLEIFNYVFEHTAKYRTWESTKS